MSPVPDYVMFTLAHVSDICQMQVWFHACGLTYFFSASETFDKTRMPTAMTPSRPFRGQRQSKMQFSLLIGKPLSNFATLRNISPLPVLYFCSCNKVYYKQELLLSYVFTRHTFRSDCHFSTITLVHWIKYASFYYKNSCRYWKITT